ncbi:MAG: Ig-like domain-containing protein [Coriobacteriia bacterium]|nr:Ig-like domain-containing protein [Coriobacteriia bacterium]
MFVGEGEELEQVTIENKGQLVQLNAYYLDATGSGVMLETASSATDLGVIDLKWESSDVDVAMVNPLNGLVTPVGDGDCTITATVADPEKYGEASVSVDLHITGQEGEYVDYVEITDENGEVITNTVVIESDGKKPVYTQLYVNVYWVDADGNEVRVESSREGNVSVSFEWVAAGSSNSKCLAVNARTGRVSTQEQGVGAVLVNVFGGKDGRAVSDTVHFYVNTGQTGYNPASSLTINVSYQMYPDQIVFTKTWSAEELESILPQYTYNFTVISGSSYATIRARGFLFKDILALFDTDLSDINQFRFGTADSYDAPVSYDYLFGSTRYYFPDYDIGYTSGGVVVPPLLATANTIFWNESYVSPEAELDEGTRYRLVFGASDVSDANTSRQVYFIDTINVVLNGAPPENPDPGPGPGDGGDGDGDGGGSGNGTGGGGNGTNGGGSGQPGSSASAGNRPATVSNAASSGGQSDTLGAAGGESNPWRIYQMMKQQVSNPGELDINNPLAPFTIPGVCAAALLGGLSAGVGFRRRLY